MMKQSLQLFSAFFMRDLMTELSYRVAFLLSLVGVLFSTLTVYFLNRLIGNNAGDYLSQYDGDYFAFAIIGLALSSYFQLGLRAFARSLREAQTTGTLEAMIMTPTPMRYIVSGSAAWSYTFTTFRVIVYFILAFFLGLALPNANLIGGFLVWLLGIVSFASFGILAASMIMVIKRGDPVTMLLGNFTGLVSGTIYPVEVLPNWLQAVAQWMPLTHALNGMREALLNGATVQELLPTLGILGLFCVVLLPISLWAFRWSVEWARRDGSLAHY